MSTTTDETIAELSKVWKCDPRTVRHLPGLVPRTGELTREVARQWIRANVSNLDEMLDAAEDAAARHLPAPTTRSTSATGGWEDLTRSGDQDAIRRAGATLSAIEAAKERSRAWVTSAALGIPPTD